MKRVISLASNNLLTDQRVHKTAQSLHLAGFRVKVIGCNKTPSEKPIRQYTVFRMNCWFKKNLFFYAELNIKFFFIVLFSKTDYVLANDLDSLPAAFLASKLKNFVLIYDSHELFTHVPELQTGGYQQKAWLQIEEFILPKITRCYTVSESIANYYHIKYKTKFGVIPNFPIKKEKDISLIYTENSIIKELQTFKREGKKIVLYQGAVNIGRGLEACIEAVATLENTVFIILGTGDCYLRLKKQVEVRKFEHKVKLYGAVGFEILPHLTALADAGVAMLENLSLSYRFALPNRIFDYTQARLPFIVSDLPEMANLVNKYGIGVVCNSFEPEQIAAALQNLLLNKEQRVQLINNMEIAAQELVWEAIEPKLLSYFT